jgi:hypothetical protein
MAAILYVYHILLYIVRTYRAGIQNEKHVAIVQDNCKDQITLVLG